MEENYDKILPLNLSNLELIKKNSFNVFIDFPIRKENEDDKSFSELLDSPIAQEFIVHVSVIGDIMARAAADILTAHQVECEVSDRVWLEDLGIDPNSVL